MFYILGWNALYGRTDKVPGLLHVGTNFFHVFFIPLIPLGTYLVRREHDAWIGGFRGVPIDFSVKSLLYAWGRTAALLTVLFVPFAFASAYYFGPDPSSYKFLYGPNPTRWSMSPGWPGILGFTVALAALWVMRVTSIASQTRAAALAQIVAPPDTKPEPERKITEAEMGPAMRALYNHPGPLGFFRSKDDAWISGFAGAFARSRGWNSTAVRLGYIAAWALLGLAFGASIEGPIEGLIEGLVLGAVVYLVLWGFFSTARAT